MKKIVFINQSGDLEVVTPVEGGRLSTGVRDAEGNPLALSKTPVPVDRFFRRWPVEGVTAIWAETEDQWLDRIKAKDVPPDAVDVQIVDESAIPTDRTFRNGWKFGSGKVEHDMTKCKAIAHERRRAMREVEFKPHDDVIAKQIPGKSATEAEAARQAIRNKYDAMQAAIDAARSVEELKAALA